MGLILTAIGTIVGLGLLYFALAFIFSYLVANIVVGVAVVAVVGIIALLISTINVG